MKSKVIRVFIFLFLASFLESAYVGKVYFNARTGDAPHKIFRVPASFLESYSASSRGIGKVDLNSRAGERNDRESGVQLAELQAYFQSEIEKGNLKRRLVQDDPEANMQHHRYTQYFNGLQVFGGEIIEHFNDGQLTGINGEYYEIGELATIPLVTKEIAIQSFKADLGRFDLVANSEKNELIVYPVNDAEYHLAYRVVLSKGAGYSMTGIVDALTGKMFLRYSNIRTDDLTIGVGNGCHRETYKFPTTFLNDKYFLANESVRPVKQYTYDYRTYDGHDWYIATDSDNHWDHDGALVSAHVFLGLTYDYYFGFLGRKGIDNNNFRIIATVHFPDPDYSDNAFWHSESGTMFFGEPGSKNEQNAGALDVVAHEFSHGVTAKSSDLVYLFESGALNESFSDILGAAVEFYWQDPGNGLLKSDWYNGEDASATYSTAGCRNLADPNSNSQMKNAGYPPVLWYPDPCHLSQKMPYFTLNGYLIDNGGVHVNSTIYSHAYYLLANGGTNKVSGKSVSSIGLDKATKIFYRAWTYWMTSTSNFLNAANYLLWSASNLYGTSSNEYAQTIKAMEAIGWVVK